MIMTLQDSEFSFRERVGVLPLVADECSEFGQV